MSKREPIPDDEHHWIDLPAEFICLAVAWGDPRFAKQNQQNLDDEAPKPTRKPK